MSHKSKCGTSCHEDKNRYRIEKKEEKQRHRQEKKEEKKRHREEKRERKQRQREEKRRHREEFISQVFNFSTTTPTTNVVVGHPGNPNVRYNNFNEIPLGRIEHDVATLRTIFPDCDPEFIRNFLANETGDDRVRKTAEKLLATNYPKVAPVSPLTPPTAPPLIIRNSFDDEAPPTYEESLGGQSLKPPPLPTRHQRASSWNGTSIQSSQSPQSSQFPQLSQLKQISRSTSNATSEVSEAIGTAVKHMFSSFKPSTVERACHKTSYVWSRPVTSHFRPKSLLQQFKVIPKDNHSIQKGFHQNNYPSKELRSHDISEEDWQVFISGLNSIIGVNSIPGNPNNFGDGFSVSLKWVSWMNVSMDERLMETNIKVLNEYLSRWNEFFFIPRKIMIQFVDDRTKSTNPFKHQQYLLVKSI